MEPFEDDKLVSALESLCPEPRPAFAAELDERAAAGFPRRAGGSAWQRLAERVRTIDPRRALVPAGATALAAIAAITVVVAVNEAGDSQTSLRMAAEKAGAPSSTRSSELNFDGAGGYLRGRTGAGTRGANMEYEAALPSSASSSATSAGSAASAKSAGRQLQPFAEDVGPYASQAPRREIERSAQLVLGTEPTQVRKATSKVFETVHVYRGIVLHSSIRDGAEGEAGARFALLIPSAKLGDAMADFSTIGEIRSRREATADITAPTVRTSELLRDSRATIEGLLAQLAQADTDAERVATEARLRDERRKAAYLRSQLSQLERRANFSRVNLQIESGAPNTPTDEDGWGVGEALDDAGQILAIAAGVTIVALAILGPIALIALLAWLANRARVKRARRRALT